MNSTQKTAKDLDDSSEGVVEVTGGCCGKKGHSRRRCKKPKAAAAQGEDSHSTVTATSAPKGTGQLRKGEMRVATFGAFRQKMCSRAGMFDLKHVHNGVFWPEHE